MVTISTNNCATYSETPNLSIYIYNNKLATGSEAAESAADIRLRLHAIGMEVPDDRGDHVEMKSYNS